MRVLIAEPLAPFLEQRPFPDDLEPELLPENAAVPAGNYVGILPLLTRKLGVGEFDRLPSLRVVANYAVGYDNIDVAAAHARGIGVSNTPGVLTVATAELTWALILAAARRLSEGESLARGGAWTGWTPTQLIGMGLDGKVLGLIGAGRIGQEVARRAPGFGMSVIYWSRTRRAEWERASNVVWRELDQLLAEADVVSLHVPHTSRTDRLLDARAMACMKPTSILINTARGGIVDEAALIEALATGRLRAAGLDVYAAEPQIPQQLRELPNTVLLPHLGSATEEARWAMWRVAAENLVRGARGEPLLTPV
jgi:glyoxylate reductase